MGLLKSIFAAGEVSAETKALMVGNLKRDKEELAKAEKELAGDNALAARSATPDPYADGYVRAQLGADIDTLKRNIRDREG